MVVVVVVIVNLFCSLLLVFFFIFVITRSTINILAIKWNEHCHDKKCERYNTIQCMNKQTSKESKSEYGMYLVICTMMSKAKCFVFSFCRYYYYYGLLLNLLLASLFCLCLCLCLLLLLIPHCNVCVSLSACIWFILLLIWIPSKATSMHNNSDCLCSLSMECNFSNDVFAFGFQWIWCVHYASKYYEYGFWKSVSNLMAEVDVLLENCAKSAILQTFKCVHDAYFSLNWINQLIL